MKIMRILHTKTFVIITYCLVTAAVAIVAIRTYQNLSFVERGYAEPSADASSSVQTIPADTQEPEPESEPKQRPMPVHVPILLEPEKLFLEDFSTTYSVQEVDDIEKSASPGWWLSSGAYFYSAQGIGSTAQGSLPAMDPRRIAYFISNPLDTDDGYRPQNIFRMVLTRDTWQDFQQEAYFRIVNNNVSASPNRNASNGLLFFNRYQDAPNLYYAGIRVDGAAVIKKKVNGTYYTLAYKQFYNVDTPYDRGTNSNVLPTQKWIGLRSTVKTNEDNTLDIRLFIDKDRTGDWVLAAEARDDGASYGGAAILEEGYVGIRTDFMDVEFDDYRIEKQ